MRTCGRVDRVMTRALATATALVACGMLMSCNKSPTEADSPNTLVAAGGLLTVSGAATVQEFRVLLDGQSVQDTNYNPAVNVAEVNVTRTGVGRGSHTLSLMVPRQTGGSASYKSYSITILVGDDNTHNVVYQGTFPDQTKTLGTGTGPNDRIDIPFSF